MITRRRFLLGAGTGATAAVSLPAYAVGIEPMWRLRVTTYDLSPIGWPVDFPLTIAVVADVHATDPWMSAERVAGIADFTNTLRADMVLLAGDYVRSLRDPFGTDVPMEACAAALARLRAPLGVHAVMGNHDAWHEGGEPVRRAFAAHGMPMLENKALRIEKEGRGFWLLGLADQLAFLDPVTEEHFGADDLAGTLAQVTTEEPVILLAHEPDIFGRVPDRVALTISGHTHGGQVRLPFLGALCIPSTVSARYDYGHFVEGRRSLIVSGGLGMSGLPLRFNAPPEIVLIRLGGAAASTA